MSTHHAKTTLAQIYKYGQEALTNRRKNLFLLSFFTIFLPQALALFVWFSSASAIDNQINATNGLPPIDQFVALFDNLGRSVLIPTTLASGIFVLGLLSLARTSVDYFESRPESMPSALKRAAVTMLTKGIGVFAMILILMPALAFMPLLRAVGISMLLMLPVTLVASGGGGFKTTWDTLWIRYASPTAFGRWPVFVNVLSVTGLFISIFFLGGYLIEVIPSMDVKLGVKAGFLEKTLVIFGGRMNAGWLISGIVALVWETFWVAVMMPFLASIYHLTTAPSGHTPFQTEV